jgi:hypothetical protein
MEPMTSYGLLSADPAEMSKAICKADASAEIYKARWGRELTREQVSLLYVFHLAFSAGWTEARTEHGPVLVPEPAPRKEA